LPTEKAVKTFVEARVATANHYIKAQFTMSGGGTITWKNGRLKWTTRMIAISMERPNSFSAGHVNIPQPTGEIPAGQVYDNTARPITSEGVPLTGWEALYAVHTVGGAESAVTYRIVRYTDPISPPSNWILVAVVNGDDNSIKLGTGIILSNNSSYTSGSWVPTGTILMWSGQENQIPAGWALCNGSNGTPDLRSRFLVGAGSGGSPAYSAGQTGEPDQHSHNLDIPPAAFGTTGGGGHTHTVPGSWYKRDVGYAAVKRNDWSLLDVGGQEARNAQVQYSGDHSHSVTVDYGPLSTTNSGDNNRPKWYAICFIMKL
jgi:hypothetical protein